MNFKSIDLFFAGILAWAPQWLVGIAVGALIVLGGFALQALVIRIVSHFSKRWDSLYQFIFLRTRRVFRIAIVLLAVGVALPLIPLPPVVVDAVRKAMLAAFILLVGYIVYLGADIAMTRYVNTLKLDVADNLAARKAATQMRVLRRAVNILIALVTLGFALMSFDEVRQFGVSLFASAGVAGLVAGLAARPVLSNLIAGMQIAMTQPIRLDDVVVVEGEWGRIEEFTSTYVVVRIWDLRRLIVPLSYFLETPFRNWTYQNSQLLGTVYLYTDYTVPVDVVRAKAIEIIKANPLWDGEVAGLVVTDSKEHTMELRALMSAADASKAWDLRCAVREELIAYIQKEYPSALPRTRAQIQGPGGEHPLEPLARNEARKSENAPKAEPYKGGESVPGISKSTAETKAKSDEAPNPDAPPPETE